MKRARGSSPDPFIPGDTAAIARAMAAKLHTHIYDLFNAEAMYMQEDSCFVTIKLPGDDNIDFSWSNDDEEGRDNFTITVNPSKTSTKPLQTCLDLFAIFGIINHSIKVKKICEDLLVYYFTSNPDATLVIESSWGDDIISQGGKIGKETGGKWIEDEDDSSDDE